MAPREKGWGWLPVAAIVVVIGGLIALAVGTSERWRSARPARVRTMATHAVPHATAAKARPSSAGLAAPAQAGTSHEVPAPAVAPPALLDASTFAQRLAASHGDAGTAWNSLLALWSIRSGQVSGAMSSPCPALKTPGLYCASGRQRLSLLAQFDRPLLLRLHANAHPAWIVLLGLGSTQALVQLDGEDLLVPRAALEGAMDGYSVVGRGPAGLALPIKRADTGAGVDWLRQRLSLPSASTASLPNAVSYDDALMAEVRARQRDFGLHPDGVVGPETLLALLAADRDGPHLRKLPE